MSEATRVLVIGASAAGAKAASRIRRLDPTAQITMIDAGHEISIAACGLPYFVGGKVKEIDELVQTTYGRRRDESYFKELKNIDTRCGVRADAIDRGAKTVAVTVLETGATETLAYDKLVLATGAAPSKPPIEGVDLDGVFHLTRLADAAAVAERVADSPGGSAVVIGAGFIGMEAAEALAARQWEVTVVERYGQVFPWALDPEMAAAVQEHCFEQMVEFELGANVRRIEADDDGRVARVVTDEDSYDADLVILATGHKPNSALARETGLEVAESGAVVVNDRLQTSDPDIFAGGDLVENRHRVTGAPCFIPLGSTANKHGRVIGDNVCGRETRFPGVLGTFVCKVFDFAVGSTGLNEQAAAKAGLDFFALRAAGFDKAHYYPGAEIVGMKIVVERSTRRLLGLQAVGKGDVARRIDVAAAVLSFGGTLDDVADLDLAYAPPYSQAMDCLINAANATRNALDGVMKPVGAQATRDLLEGGDDAIVLDVRSPTEFLRGHIDDDEKVVNIPLDDLGARMGELPRDKKIVCACVLGLRSFSAQRQLEAAGFNDVGTLEGGMFLWPWKDELA